MNIIMHGGTGFKLGEPGEVKDEKFKATLRHAASARLA